MIDENSRIQRIHSLRLFSDFSGTTNVGLINKAKDKPMRIQLAEHRIEEVILMIVIFYNAYTQSNLIQTFFDLCDILVGLEDIKNKKIILSGYFHLIFNLTF